MSITRANGKILKKATKTQRKGDEKVGAAYAKRGSGSRPESRGKIISNRCLRKKGKKEKGGGSTGPPSWVTLKTIPRGKEAP